MRTVVELTEPRTYQEYMPLTDTYETYTFNKVVVSFGRAGDTAIFPATPDGKIYQYDALYDVPYWTPLTPEEFVKEWLNS